MLPDESTGYSAPPELKHSGLGIASFVLSLLVGLLTFVVVAIAGVVETTTPGGMDEQSAAAVVIGLAVIALVLMNLVALGLGVAGLLQKERKRLFAVLGIVFSATTVLGVLGLMVIGIMAG